MRWWVVASAFLLFVAGLGWQFVVLTNALAAGYPQDIGGHLTRDVDGTARDACVIGAALLLVLAPMVLRGWKVAAGATVVVAVLYLGLGILLRGWPLVAGAVVGGVVAALAIDLPTRSPGATTPSA